MNEINKILESRDFFQCEQFKAKISKSACIQRQTEYEKLSLEYERGLTRTPNILERLLSLKACSHCEQGKKVRTETMDATVNPQRGQGNRETDCQFYSDCLDHAAKHDWKSWKCDECSHYNGKEKPKVAKKENTRICETEGCERITLSQSCPYCASCMAKRANNGQKKRPTKSKAQKKANGKAKAEIASPRSNTEITIQFGKYASVLKEVEDLAEQEMRPVDMQVVFILKNHLESLKEDQKI